MQAAMILTYSQERTLRSFAVLHFLKVDQITRLFYSSGSARYVNAQLKSLSDNRYLVRQALPSIIRAGSVPYIYTLAPKGRRHLISIGYDLLRRSSSFRNTLHSYHFLDHNISVTEVLIAAVLLSKYNDSISVADIRHDLTLKQLLHGYVVPDGFIDIRIRDNLQICFFLELDRGTESKRQIQQKIAGLLRFVLPPAFNAPTLYERLFETTSLTIFYAIVSQPEKRLTDIIRWTDEVLTRTGNTAECDLFRFALIPDGPVDPRWLFFTPIWRRIEGTSLVPLLGGIISDNDIQTLSPTNTPSGNKKLVVSPVSVLPNRTADPYP